MSVAKGSRCWDGCTQVLPSQRQGDPENIPANVSRPNERLDSWRRLCRELPCRSSGHLFDVDILLREGDGDPPSSEPTVYLAVEVVDHSTLIGRVLNPTLEIEFET